MRPWRNWTRTKPPSPASWRAFELLGGEVDADDRAGVADLRGGEEGVGPGTAAEVDHPLARTEVGEIEEVADAGEGLDRRGGDPVEDLGGVAQPLGE